MTPGYAYGAPAGRAGVAQSLDVSLAFDPRLQDRCAQAMRDNNRSWDAERTRREACARPSD